MEQAREREARANAEAAALARNQLEVAQEAFEKRLAESEAAKQALTRQLEDLQQLSLPSPVKQARQLQHPPTFKTSLYVPRYRHAAVTDTCLYRIVRTCHRTGDSGTCNMICV